MMKKTGSMRGLRLVALLAALAVPACESSTDEGDDHPADAVVEVRLTIGPQTLVFDGDGTDGSYDINRGTHAVTMVAIDAEGDVLSLSDVVLEITSSSNTVARFNRVTPLGGTLTAGAVGTTTLQVWLAHDGHEEWGPFPVQIRVN